MKKLNALQFLRDDHKRIRGLCTQSRASHLRAPSMEDGVIRELIMEVGIHSRIEEELFYPEVFKSEDPTTRALVDESKGEHGRVDNLLEVLKMLDVREPKFHYTLNELINSLDEHLQKEEEDLFLRVEREMPERLDVLGEAFMKLRDELARNPVFANARAEAVQNPNGGEQMRKRGAA